MAKILLIQPPIEDFYLTAKRTIPYGLACIAACLQQAGFSVEILDALASGKARCRPWPDEMGYLHPFYGRPDVSPFALFLRYRRFGYSDAYFEDGIRRSGADLVGIAALFTAYSGQALEMAAIARRALPGAVIVLGGHHPTALPESVMAHPDVDYVLRGEGEIALPLLVQALEGTGRLEQVPGLVRRRPGRGLDIGSPAWIADLDTLPPPAEGLIQAKFYRRGGAYAKVMVTSRGCPLKCSYCCLGRETAVPYRRRGLASIARELEAAMALDPPGFIDFEDENLTLSKPWFMALMGVLADHLPAGAAELRAMNGLFPPSLDREMVATMARGGFRTLNLALATTDSRQLQRFGRPDVRPHLERIFQWSRELGLNAVTYLIAGAPRQTASSSLADLLYLATQPTLAGLSVFYPAPGSADYELCGTLGLLPDDPRLLRATALPVDHTPTRLETVTLLRLSRILNYMKRLRAHNEPLPRATRPAANLSLDTLDRDALGRRLLSWFSRDGQIRGITPDGEVYIHPAVQSLTQGFLRGVPASSRVQSSHNILKSIGSHIQSVIPAKPAPAGSKPGVGIQ